MQSSLPVELSSSPRQNRVVGEQESYLSPQLATQQYDSDDGIFIQSPFTQILESP